jgi:(p)ppGpp synthase/HD superfamily hydrolase
MILQDNYLRALHFAARAHGDQKTLSGLPYIVHVATVAMELTCALRVDPGHDEALAITCALLHDVVEDTRTSLDEIAEAFGPRVAAGVAALTKNAALPPAEQMQDSLQRILQQGPEVAMVKLADRITNIASPPAQWKRDKIAAYRREAEEILAALGGASEVLAERLRQRIAGYR